MSKVRRFYNGIAFEPLSADPSSPVQGQIQFADGTARAEGLWQYKGGAWTSIGGGGGSLDFFYAEDFENTSASDLSLTGTSWTIADNESTQISGDRSIKLTMTGTTVAGDQVALTSPNIALELNQKDSTIGFQGRYLYDGNAGEVDFVIYDVTNSAVLTRLALPSASSVTTFRAVANTLSTTANIKWYFEVATANNGAVLEFDNLEGKVNPLMTVGGNDVTDWEDFTPTASSAYGTITNNTGRIRHVGDSIECEINFTSGTLAASVGYIDIPSGYTLDTSKIGGDTDNVLGTYRYAYGTNYFSSSGGMEGVVSYNGTNTDRLYLVARPDATASFSYTDTVTTFIGSGTSVHATFTIPVLELKSSSANVVFEGQTSGLDWQAYTPTITGLGTMVTVDFKYRRVGDSVEIRGFGTCGTPTAVRGKIGLPSGLSMDISKVRTTDQQDVIGYIDRLNAATGVQALNQVLYVDSADYSAMYFTKTVTSDVAFAADNASDNFNAGDSFSMVATVPIDGWKSSDIIMSVPVTNEVENVFSARIDSTATTPAVATTSAPFISSITDNGTGDFTVNFVSGFFTEIPSVVATVSDSSESFVAQVVAPSTSSVRVTVRNNDDGAASLSDQDFTIIVQRQGSDYKNPKGYFLGNLSQPVGYLKDVKTAGTNGGTFTGGAWQTRDLNTTEGDFGLFGTLSSNQFTLEAGTYEIEAKAPANAVNRHAARLYNVTDASVEINGQAGITDNGGNVNDNAIVEGVISITSSKTFEIRHQSQTTGTTTGFGYNINSVFTVPEEVYTIVKIRKLK